MNSPTVVKQIDALIDQSLQLHLKEPDEAFRLARQAERLLQQAALQGDTYHLGQANVEASLCWLSQNRGEYEQALKSGLAALASFETLDDKRYLPHALGSLGITHGRLGNLDKALSYFFRHLAVSEQAQDSWNIARAHLGLGFVYARLDDFVLANKHQMQSLSLYRELGDIERQATVINNLCFSAVSQGNFKEALQLGLQGVALNSAGELKGSVVVYLHSNIYKAYLGLGKAEAASKHLDQAYKIAMTTSERFMQAMVIMDRGRFALHLNQTAEAIEWFRQALALSEASSINVFLREGHKLLAGLYKQTGEIAQALHHHEQFHLAAVKTLKHESTIRVQSLTTTHQVEKEQNEAEILRLRTVELQQRVDEQTAQLRHSLQREQQLAQQLRQALDRADVVDQLKSRVIKVVSHEFRTPMTVISNSAGLIANYFEHLSAENRLQQVENMQSAVKDLASMVGEVEAVAESNTAALSPTLGMIALGDLCSQLSERIESTATHPERVEIEIEPLLERQLITIDADMVGSIAQALLSNALKFSAERVTVLVSVENNTLSITVSDAGIGVPADEKGRIFELLERGSNVGSIRGLGVGLFLAQQFALLLGGQIRLASSAVGQGSQFVAEILLNIEGSEIE